MFRFFGNVTLCALSLVFTLALGEAFVRIQYPEFDEVVSRVELVTEFHPTLGWSKTPNTKTVITKREYQTVERINSKGIRGPEYSYEKEDNEFRILVLGDSFAEGYTVEFEQLFSERLKTQLQEKSNFPIQVINAGTGGYSTDQELRFFTEEGRKYKPDLTILMFYQNDIWYNNQDRYWRGHKPKYELVNGELSLRNIPLPKDSFRFNETTGHAKGDRKRKKIQQHPSFLYRFVLHRMKNNYKLHKLGVSLGLFESSKDIKEKLSRINEEFDVFRRTYPPQTQEAWDITEALFKKLKAETEAIGSDLLIFHIPLRASIYLEEWDATKRKYNIRDKEWNILQVANEFQSICARNSLTCIEPTEVFRKKARLLEKEGKRLYFKADGHWNSAGHQFVGDLLFQSLRDQ